MKDYSYLKYLEVCQKAVADDTVFANFRSYVDYVTVVEACGRKLGTAYLKAITQDFPHLLYYMPLFHTSDSVGGPAVFYYKKVRRGFSPTTLRYIKVLGDLEHLFGKLDDMDIIEIGGGYGGQCKIIHDIAKPRSYTIVDLPDALKLSEKYLDCFEIKDIVFKQPTDDFANSYSLCISNYAFSEVSYNYQKTYAEKIIKHCKNGYMTCNHFSRKKTKLMYALDIFKSCKNKKGEFSPEYPLTGLNNILYTWTGYKERSSRR